MEMTGPAIQNGAQITVLSISTNSSASCPNFFFFSARTETFSEDLRKCVSAWSFTFHGGQLKVNI